MEGQGPPQWQVSLRTLLPTAAEMGWLHYPDQCLHFNISLFSFISNLVLHVLGLLMPHCSTNHAATALLKQCVCSRSFPWDWNPWRAPCSPILNKSSQLLLRGQEKAYKTKLNENQTPLPTTEFTSRDFTDQIKF